MVTGKVSETTEILHSRSGFRLKADALNSPQLMMALGGWLPAACRGVCFIPDGFSRRPTGTRIAIWRQKLADTKICNEIDWYYKACLEEHPRITARS